MVFMPYSSSWLWSIKMSTQYHLCTEKSCQITLLNAWSLFVVKFGHRSCPAYWSSCHKAGRILYCCFVPILSSLGCFTKKTGTITHWNSTQGIHYQVKKHISFSHGPDIPRGYLGGYETMLSIIRRSFTVKMTLRMFLIRQYNPHQILDWYLSSFE